jgi:hypothetical protein
MNTRLKTAYYDYIEIVATEALWNSRKVLGVFTDAVKLPAHSVKSPYSIWGWGPDDGRFRDRKYPLVNSFFTRGSLFHKAA